MELSELIEALEAADPSLIVTHGFANPHSYRGYYSQLAFEPARNVTVAAMLADARSALGATFQGWKGGDYTMDGSTTCWLSIEGECSDEPIAEATLRHMLESAMAAARLADLTADHAKLGQDLDRARELVAAAQLEIRDLRVMGDSLQEESDGWMCGQHQREEELDAMTRRERRAVESCELLQVVRDDLAAENARLRQQVAARDEVVEKAQAWRHARGNGVNYTRDALLAAVDSLQEAPETGLSAPSGDQNAEVVHDTTDGVEGQGEALGVSGHPEDTCGRCGGPNYVWMAPSPLWNAVMRGGDIAGEDLYGGIVCPTCFAALAEEQGIAEFWRLDAQRVHVGLDHVTPDGRIWNVDTWMWVQSAAPIAPAVWDAAVDPSLAPGEMRIGDRVVNYAEGPALLAAANPSRAVDHEKLWAEVEAAQESDRAARGPVSHQITTDNLDGYWECSCGESGRGDAQRHIYAKPTPAVPPWLGEAIGAAQAARLQHSTGTFGGISGFGWNCSCDAAGVGSAMDHFMEIGARAAAPLIAKGVLEEATGGDEPGEAEWTMDETGRSNSSAEFLHLCAEVEQLIRNDARVLLSGNAGGTARLILAQLAHKHGLVSKSWLRERAARRVTT